uniref:RICIN domain-containing protein n=1 Tax=Candidatus Fimivicinus sp. TaxID=3056640 RepID=UPI003FED47DE
MAGKTTNKDHPFNCAAYYTITSKLSGKAVTACGDTDVRMFAPTGEDNQQWKPVEVAPGVYQLLSKATGKALDIILAGENDGAQLHQWENISAPTQSWKLEQAQDGCYKLKSAVSGKCLDIVDISLLDDARLQIWEDLDGDNQKWVLNALPVPKPARKPRAPKKKSDIKAESTEKLTKEAQTAPIKNSATKEKTTNAAENKIPQAKKTTAKIENTAEKKETAPQKTASGAAAKTVPAKK